ncbi:MAG: MFS transporter [Dehalococcoidia bacterium]|jgi:EmrB/QacA subfamily drug resistance transporter
MEIDSTQSPVSSTYKWIALSNTTLAVLLAFLNSSSLILALPVIFRGIGINPLAPNSFTYLLWLLVGYMLVLAVLVVTFGRLGDLFGRTRMYNLGFAIFTIGSLLCAVTWSTGPAGAVELIIFRVVQGIGSAFLFANSAAILTDAFPVEQRGMALGLNQVAGIAGSLLGILVGGLLAEIGWRWVFLFNVPIGIIGTVWAYLSLKEIGIRKREPIDWLGNITFAAGLSMLLTGITYGINPSGASLMSWTTPFVLGMLIGGIVLLVAFIFIERRVRVPMFRLNLFRIRAFAAGNVAGFLASVARGGLMFMLVIWLQGIWLPMRGYDFEVTPLWAGIYMVPMSIGFLVAGPLFGRLSDRYGARYFATGGMLLAAISFGLMIVLPVNFSYPAFAVLILLNGVAMGMFTAPNTAAIMNSVPARHRGVSSGMRATLINAGMPLSITIFFSFMILGMNALVPSAMYGGLTQQGMPAPIAQRLADVPAITYLFAAFLGYNPLGTLIPPQVLHALPPAQAATITSRTFFPQLISGAFDHGLVEVLIFSIVMCLIAAGASWLRGGKYVYREEGDWGSSPGSS